MISVQLTADAEGRSCGCCGDDGDSHIVLYEWDLDGDGIIDQSGADLAQVQHTYDATGEFQIRVIVTDSRSVTDEAQVTIVVE